MPFFEDIHEFTARQGSKPLFVGNRYLFPNGAQSDGMGNHCDPPDDPGELAQLRFEFVRAKLENAKKRYRDDYTNIKESAEFHKMGAGPGPAPGWESYLKRAAQHIQRLETQLQQIAAKLPRTELAQSKQAYINEHRRAGSAELAKLQQLPTF